jgi:hypothetical protein
MGGEERWIESWAIRGTVEGQAKERKNPRDLREDRMGKLGRSRNG